jgi:hypothetical protein
MTTRLNRATLVTVGSVLIAGAVALADGSRFADFTPLTASAPPTTDESMPITFGNPLVNQLSIADVETQLAALKPNSGVWDMNTVNETGEDKGRYLFTVFESGTSGVQRHDLETGETDTIWQVPPGDVAARFDPAFWTPWGTLITGEENWGCGDGVCGRLFEFRNPTTAPAIFDPVGPLS